jgi:hypothetical protein
MPGENKKIKRSIIKKLLMIVGLSSIVVLGVAVIAQIVMLISMDILIQKDNGAIKRAGQKTLRPEPDITADDSHDGAGQTSYGQVKDDKVQECDQEEDATPEGLRAALEMLRQSSQYGDPRTPEIDPAPPVRIWTPDANTLNSPEEYAKQQKKAREKNIANVSAAFQSRIIKIENKIAEAELNATRTPAEIDEAAEALEEMVKLNKQLNKIP